MTAMSKSPLMIILGLAVGGLSGWFTGRLVFDAGVPAKDNAAAAKVVTPAKVPEAKAANATAFEKDEVLQARMVFAQQVQKAGESELGLLLKRAQELTDPMEREQRVHLVALQFAEVSAEASATKFITDDPEVAVGIMKGWAAKDGSTALRWAMDLKKFDQRMLALDTLLPAMAASNPEGLLEFTNQMKDRALDSPETYRAIFSAMTLKDPAKAVSQIPGIKVPALREQACAGAAESWARLDAPAAVAWARGLTAPNERANALQSAVRVMAETDPRGAMSALDQLDPGIFPVGEKPHAAIAAGLAKLDLKESIKWVKSLEVEKHDVESILTESVLGALPEINATSLVELYQGVDVAKQNSDFAETVNVGRGLQSVLLQWRPADLGAALQEAGDLPSSEARQSVINYLSWRLASEQPDQALATAATAPPAVQERLARHLATTSASKGQLTSVMQALELTKDPTRKLELSREAAVNLSKHHPEQAAAFLEQLPAEAQPAAAAKMIPSLVGRDPQSALALAEKLPEEARATHVNLVSHAWAREDAQASLRWATAQPAGPQRDAAASGVVSALYEKEPRTAYPLAREISDKETRVSQLQAVFGSWMFNDAGAAQLAIASSGLPPDELAAALTPPPDGHPNPAARDRDLGTEDEEATPEEPTPPTK